PLLPPLPTRRSSDLHLLKLISVECTDRDLIDLFVTWLHASDRPLPAGHLYPASAPLSPVRSTSPAITSTILRPQISDAKHAAARSEEHTSELQSRFD